MKTYPNPYNLPNNVLAVTHQFQTCEYASISGKGEPITYPMLPFVSPDGRTFDVATGLTYPAKAERARRNPKVALLYSYPRGSKLADSPTVLIVGRAAVRDQDLQANTDRYINGLKERGGLLPFPGFMQGLFGWYYTRIWMDIMPVRIMWWAHGGMDTPPERWDAPADQTYPESDPAPQGEQPPRWKDAPTDWRERASYAFENLGTPVLTVIDADGYPALCRVKGMSLTTNGFEFTLPAHAPAPAQGKACLTFHSHPEVFTGQENIVFIGIARMVGSSVSFTIERCPGDWSIPAKGLEGLRSFIGSGMKLAPRLKAEAERRGQPVPKVKV